MSARMSSQGAALGTARSLARGLRALAEEDAPATLLPGVLDALELGDRYFGLDTPLGQVFVAYNERGLSLVTRAATAADFEHVFRGRMGRPIAAVAAPPGEMVTKLERRLRGDGRQMLRFDLRGLSEFEQAVLLKALEIPRGEVRPYAWVAREIGHPKAVRAVGTALGHNPVPLFIPCHRVVRSDGSIGRYSLGGDDAKRTILAAEGVAAEALETLAQRGVRYVGSDTTRIYCFPTCRHARRVMERHQVRFGSEAEALGAGYRPCKICRPAREA